MGTGGLVFEELPAEAREELGFEPTQLALRIRHVGQYGEHAAGKKAGFQRGDILVEFDGRTEHMTETALLAHAVQKHSPGERVPTTVLRDGKRIELELPMQ